jgi:CheY-like chemotaxis protein
VDVAEFMGLTGAVERSGDLAGLDQAIALYRGPFLEGFSLRDSPGFEHWALNMQERLQRQAMGALARERPQVLVADIGMAGEDGYALLQKVRSLPSERGGGTPAIALTGYASQQDRMDALRAGFQMHVSKPVTPADLAAAVASLVAPARPGSSSR